MNNRAYARLFTGLAGTPAPRHWRYGDRRPTRKGRTVSGKIWPWLDRA